MRERRNHVVPFACVVIAAAAIAGVTISNFYRGDGHTAPADAGATGVSSAAHAADDDSAFAAAQRMIPQTSDIADPATERPNHPGPEAASLLHLAQMFPAAAGNHAPLDGSALVELIPSSLIESARSTVWDERMVESLEQLMVLAFDADGDRALSDFERITAVQSMRDAMWSVPPDDALAEAVEVGAGVVAPRITDITLQPGDLTLHHDTDEARRLDHAPDDGDEDQGSDADDALREVVVARFQLDDDGRLSADEYARFLLYYNSGALAADLDLDGRVDERDLRLFLDVASPVEE